MNSLQQYIDLYNANRDAIERNAPEFSGNFQDVVNSAAANVKGAVNSFTGSDGEKSAENSEDNEE